MKKLFSTCKAAFVTHPATVGESYWQHMGMALSFACTMLLSAVAAMIHGIFPFLFVRTGRNTVLRLHDRMITYRDRTAPTEHPVGNTNP